MNSIIELIDNGGKRLGLDRRIFSYTYYIPERRSGNDRRSGKDRRNRRSISYFKVNIERRAAFM
jgi:hypothetical protein